MPFIFQSFGEKIVSEYFALQITLMSGILPKAYKFFTGILLEKA